MTYTIEGIDPVNQLGLELQRSGFPKDYESVALTVGAVNPFEIGPFLLTEVLFS
jgi:hypothetical protein